MSATVGTSARAASAGQPERATMAVQMLAFGADLAIVMGGTAVLHNAGPVGAAATTALLFAPPYMWSRYGRSLGLALWGLYLAPTSGEGLTFRRALWRYGWMFGFLCLSLLVVAAVPWRAAQAFPQQNRRHPFDDQYGLEVLRYEFPPASSDPVDRVLDRMAIFAGLRATDVDEDREPTDWHGMSD